MRKNILAVVTATAALWVAPSQALTIFDIAGSGSVCTYNASATCNTQFLSITGVVTLDVNPAGPAGADHFTDGSTYDQDLNGWVAFSAQLAWSGGTYATTAVPGATFSEAQGIVSNNRFATPLDELYVRFASESQVHTNLASFTRNTYDTTWLSGLAFLEAAGLAPTALNNSIGFEDLSCGSSICDGVTGRVDLNSMIVRSIPDPVAVPEPATLSLLSLGLAGLGLAKRRRGLRPVSSR